ncbi:MAG: DUF5803 family protein [Halobacteriota archaeon]
MRRLLAVLALVVLVGLAGCTGGVVDQNALEEPATYDWDSSAEVSVNVTGGSYQSVTALGNQSNVSLFGPGEFGGESAIPVSSVQYQYPNGTVVNASAVEVAERDDRTVLEAPRSGGKIAYRATVQSNRLFLPVTVNGSYAVTLPEGTDVSLPVIGRATPGDYEADRTGERVTLTWSNPETQVISVEYYQERNLYIFAGLVGLLGLVAAAGMLYFRTQLRQLARRTGEIGPEDGLE